MGEYRVSTWVHMPAASWHWKPVRSRLLQGNLTKVRCEAKFWMDVDRQSYPQAIAIALTAWKDEAPPCAWILRCDMQQSCYYSVPLCSDCCLRSRSCCLRSRSCCISNAMVKIEWMCCERTPILSRIASAKRLEQDKAWSVVAVWNKPKKERQKKEKSYPKVALILTSADRWLLCH